MSIRDRVIMVLAVAVAAGVFVGGARRGEPKAIVAEPETAPAPPVLGVHESAPEVGVASPRPMTTSPRRRAPRIDYVPTIPLDYVEPWTGEDLKPVVVAARAARPGVDRVDPWNPSIIHPRAAPNYELDGADPWGNPLASVASRPVEHAKRTFDKTSPWDDPPAATSSAATTL